MQTIQELEKSQRFGEVLDAGYAQNCEFWIQSEPICPKCILLAPNQSRRLLEQVQPERHTFLNADAIA